MGAARPLTTRRENQMSQTGSLETDIEMGVVCRRVSRKSSRVACKDVEEAGMGRTQCGCN